MDLDLSTVDDEILQRADAGQTCLAFAQAVAAYTELLPAYEWQSECEISDEAESYIGLMDDIAQEATDPGDQAYIYQRCIELANDDTQRLRRFLQIAVRFILPENRVEFDETIAANSNMWSKDVFATIQLTAIRRLEGDAAADTFMEEHLEFDEVRKYAYDNAIVI